MSDSPEFSEPRLFDGVSRLLVAAAIAALAVCAQRWATAGFATQGVVSPVEVAAIVGVSGILGNANLPLLVRVAIQLGALWLLRQAFGEAGAESVWCGLFFVSAAAIFAGFAAAGLSRYLDSGAAPDDPPRKLTTGDLLAALFAFSAYVAIAQHEASALGPETLPLAESAVVYVLLPYVVLIVAERLIGRMGAAVAVCLAAVAALSIVPQLELIAPFATVLVVALRTIGHPSATTSEVQAARVDGSLA